jgi:hypothetical protein
MNSLCDRFEIALLSLCDRFSIDRHSLRKHLDRTTIAIQLLSIRYAIALRKFPTA